jgi:hypothetical protein
MPLHTGAKDMSAHDEHAGGASGFRGAQALRQDWQRWVIEAGGRIERQEVGECEVVLPPGERLQAKEGAIELGEGHGEFLLVEDSRPASRER